MFFRLWRLRRIGRATSKILSHSIAIEDIELVKAARAMNQKLGEALEREAARIEKMRRLRKLRQQL